VRVPSRSGCSSLMRTSSMSMSEISTPRSFTAHVSYCSGMTRALGSCARARLAGEGGTCNTALDSLGTPSCSTTDRVLSTDALRPSSWASWTGCGSTRRAGSGGSVAEGAAEESPRGVLVMASAASGAASTVSAGRYVGGRPSGVYWVPTST